MTLKIPGTSINNAANAIELAQGDNLIVNLGISVSSTGGDGVYLTSDNNIVNVAGSVSGVKGIEGFSDGSAGFDNIIVQS